MIAGVVAGQGDDWAQLPQHLLMLLVLLVLVLLLLRVFLLLRLLLLLVLLVLHLSDCG
jgi:hypothetical protein